MADDDFIHSDDLHVILAAQKNMVKMTEHYVKIARDKLNYRLGMPKIIFKNLGSVAGRALCGRNTVIYNPHYVRRNSEDMILNTTGHEVAHLVGHGLTGIAGHEKNWRNVMWAFGLSATRCHNYDDPKSISNNPHKEYTIESGVAKPTNIGRIITFD